VSTWFRTYGFADILDDLMVGAYPRDAQDVAILRRLGVERVLNLVEDDEYRPGERDTVGAALARSRIAESRVRLTDYGELPPDAFEQAVQEVIESLVQGERIYVHCRAGWQRSAAVAAGVVAVRSGMDIDDAVEFVRVRKPDADPLPHQRENLRSWWAARNSNVPPPPREVPRSREELGHDVPTSTRRAPLRDVPRGS
jgi:atypical dual specificity phosphatase